MNAGALVGIVLGSLVICLVLAYLVYVYVWKPSRNRPSRMPVEEDDIIMKRMKQLRGYDSAVPSATKAGNEDQDQDQDGGYLPRGYNMASEPPDDGMRETLRKYRPVSSPPVSSSDSDKEDMPSFVKHDSDPSTFQPVEGMNNAATYIQSVTGSYLSPEQRDFEQQMNMGSV